MVRRGANRAEYDIEAIKTILDAGLIAHVGVQTPEGPLVLPMAYGRDDDTLYLHGALANHLLGSGEGHDICATVTHVDGLVMARTPFHNSMNYRSVVVRGLAVTIEDRDEKLRALKLITDHVVKNWDTTRPVSELDIKKTLVLQVSLAEARHLDDGFISLWVRMRVPMRVARARRPGIGARARRRREHQHRTDECARSSHRVRFSGDAAAVPTSRVRRLSRGNHRESPPRPSVWCSWRIGRK